MDEVRFWSVARSPEDIVDNMILLSDRPAGLDAYFQFNDDANTIWAVDSTGNGNDGQYIGPIYSTQVY